jgi:hypothetical protein
MGDLTRLWKGLIRWLGGAPDDLEVTQMELIELAIRRSSGDPIRASAVLHSAGARASMLFLVDPMDLLEMDQEHIAAHLRRKDGR